MRIEVLDHGYVRLIEPWGTGEAGRDRYRDALTPGDSYLLDGSDYEIGIVEAARQSTQGTFRGWDEDAKLLKRLYTHRHSTPFEFSGMTVEIQAPLTVFREWQRHRTQSYNEMSARYAPLPDLYYLPGYENVHYRGNAETANKQAQGIKRGLKDTDAYEWVRSLEAFHARAEQLYQAALNLGVPKELARLSMPVSHYSRMRAAANLHNWLAFMTLRCAPDVMQETRQFADAVAAIVARIFPKTFALWCDAPRVRCEKAHDPILHAEGPCPLCVAISAVRRD